LRKYSCGAFANLATSTAVDRGVVAQLSEANSRLAKKMEDNALALKEIKVLLKKERAERATVGTLSGHLTTISRLLLITISCTTVTK
jgi:hypothetical protein